ncbi:APC family permease [Kitasatospora sp. NPDC056800]|uniref:APC family permease n=1 Tax=Kitasatospora sp. NPDC056800 TaxID=3345948 RepID=UPI0036C215C6
MADPRATDPAATDPATAAAGPTASGSAPSAGYAQDLSRSLSLRENMLITLSSVTPASSVFIVMPAVIRGLGGAAAVAFALAAAVGVLMALCYAELSSAFPVTGGEYAFAARTLGRSTGFALFALSLLGGVLVTAVIALGTGGYLGVLWSALDGKGTGLAVIALASLVAVLDIRTNAWVTGVFLLLELAAVAVLAVLGFVHVDQPVSVLWTPQALGSAGGDVLVGASWGLVASFTTTAIFAYNGYGTAVYFAEETRRASSIGRVVLWSLGITVAAECLPLVGVLLGTPSMSGLMSAASPMSYFLLERAGSTVNTVVSLGIAVAVVNAVIAIMLQSGRLLFSSARDRAWPDRVGAPLASVHPRLRTPLAATLTMGVATLLVGWLVSLDTLILATGSTLVVVYVLVALSALSGRIRGTTATAPYRMRGWPYVPLGVVAIMLYVGYESVRADWRPIAIAVGMTAVGYAYYYAYLHPRRADRWTMPDPVREEDGGATG